MTSERLAVAPGHLRPETRAWWARMVGTFELEPHHAELLLLASEALDRGAEARERLEADGAYFVDRWGQPKVHPAVAVERASGLAVAKLIAELQLVELPSHGSSRRGGR